MEYTCFYYVSGWFFLRFWALIITFLGASCYVSGWFLQFILTDEEVKTKERVWMALNGEFLKEQEEKAKRKAEIEAAKPPKIKRKRRKLNINASTAGECDYWSNTIRCLLSLSRLYQC